MAQVDYRSDEQPGALYKEQCPKCRGRGVFTGYSGRTIGRCFACKGVGYKEFAQPSEVRAEARAKSHARKARNEAENLNFFAAKSPDVWAWIEASKIRFEFAQAMHGAVAKYGELTERQMETCERMVGKQKDRETAKIERIKSAPVVAVDKLMASFDKAKAKGAKRPKLRFPMFEASLAPSHGKNAGAIYLKSGESYLGKIQNGKYLSSATATPEEQTAIVEAMDDPIANAIAYGRRTGNCSCCGRELTDPESVQRGIGPICADKFF